MAGKSSALMLLILCTSANAWVFPDPKESFKYFLSKPYIVPSGERKFHSVYTHIGTNSQMRKLFGKIYVALINGEFYFGGHSEDEDNLVSANSAVFVTNYLEKITDDKFFYLHNDMVKMQKTEMDPAKTLDNICDCTVTGVQPCFVNADKNVVRFGNRMPMMYQADDHKCIGTYDSLTDRFTCANVKTSQVQKIDNFLYDPDTGAYTKGNSVELFCRVPHEKKTYT